MLDQAAEQADACVLLLHQRVTERVREGQDPERADGVYEERVRAVERVDEAAVRQAGPPPRLNRSADLQGQLVDPHLPIRGVDPFLPRESPERPVGAHRVEAVIVHAHVRQVGRHVRQRARASDLQEAAVAGRIELQER